MPPFSSSLGHVYHIENCRHAKPNPKNKFVGIACFDAGVPFGFLISSRISPYLQRQYRLHPCEVPIPAVEHAFLKHDSWIDCTTIYDFVGTELTNLRGKLSDNAKNALLKGVAQCPVIPRHYKNLITK